MLHLSVVWTFVTNQRIFLAAVLLTFLLPTSIETPHTNKFILNPDLDELPWYVHYVEESPTWEVSNVMAPFPVLEGKSVRCALTGGTRYSNVPFFHELPADPSSNTFKMDISFYYRPVSTFNDNSSIVQALEFSMNKWSDQLRYEWAVQWENVGTGAPQWKYWGRDPKNPNGLPEWINLGISGVLAGEHWYTVTLEGKILAGKVQYKKFTIDDRQGHSQIYVLNIAAFSPDPAPGWPDKLAVMVQLDGNKDQFHQNQLTPYEVFLDHVSFKHLSNSDTTGVFRPSNGALYLKNTNTTGFADVQINYGFGGDYPVVGDWDGDGNTTIGIYRSGSFYLRNSNTIGFADVVFPFGAPGDQPIAGDWNGDGRDTIGVYRNGIFFLQNDNSAGAPDASFALGTVGDVGIAGDWNEDGIDTTGVYRPSNGALYLKNTNVTGFADMQINYGVPGDQPVVGDWDGDGIDTIGVYRNGSFYLRNSNTIGNADIVFALGIPGDMPIAGNWSGKP
jgi:hypothetical protein